MISIRAAGPADAGGIETVHRQAFPTDAEPRLVALLTERGKGIISLVAEKDGMIVGHILFSPVTIERPDHSPTKGLGLAPLAVLPEFQRRAIGSELMRAGLAVCREQGIPFVALVGHPAYYPRFGFVPASRFGLTCDFGSGDSFQILVWREGGLPPGGGDLRYATEFYELFDPPA